MTTLVPPETTAPRSRWRTAWHRAAHAGRPLRRRPVAWLSGGAALLVALALGVLTMPVPVLDDVLTRAVARRVSDQVACPGVLTRAPAVTVGDGRLVPQVIRGKLADVRVSVPDATLNGVPHAAFAGTLHNVSQPAPDRTHADRVDAAITVGFAHLPAAGGPAPGYRRAPDGGLTVDVLVPGEATGNVRATLYLRMRLRGETVRSVPERLVIFGRTVPAAQATELAGGVRTQQLPHLPAGVTYRSVTPRRDGVHVTLEGVSTTALDALPSEVGGRKVTYTAGDGLLGIATSLRIAPIVGIPLTIFTAPRLDGGKLTLVPRSVRILGADRPTTDPLARLVLTQIHQQDLTRTLPALPPGVRYRSVGVDAGGIKVTVGGVTVRPFATLPQPAGRPTTFGADDGLLTATAKGGSDGATPIVLHARPTIRGRTLDIAPQQIEMFGARFPAANVLAEVKGQQTTFPLQALPAHLAYGDVQVLADGLLIHLAGRDVTLARGALTGGGC
jgi:hypothetical protein